MPTVRRSCRLFPHGNDSCLSIFATVYPRFLDFPRHARILEVGCAEADWIAPMKAVRPDVYIVGIDQRGCQRKAADELIEADVLTAQFPADSFDAVVFISSLEHIGLGHYGDPIDPDGDTKAMQLARQWLAPGGRIYADIPWNPDPGYEVPGTECRIYDDAAITSRLGRPDWQGWAAYGNEGELVLTRPTERRKRFWYCANVWSV